jgi:hypothetical protein
MVQTDAAAVTLALVGEVPARLAAAPAKEASKLAIDMTLSRLPDGLENAVQNAAARRPGGSLWQVCGSVADGEVPVPGYGVHGLNPFDGCERFSFICCASAKVILEFWGDNGYVLNR